MNSFRIAKIQNGYALYEPVAGYWRACDERCTYYRTLQDLLSEIASRWEPMRLAVIYETDLEGKLK